MANSTFDPSSSDRVDVMQAGLGTDDDDDDDLEIEEGSEEDDDDTESDEYGSQEMVKEKAKRNQKKVKC